MHNPEKKDKAISAIADGVILVFSALIFIARRRCNSARPSVMILGFTGKDRELAHRVDRKAALLVSLVVGTMLEKSLNVVPAKRAQR
jgi:hypothetical protein